MSDLQWNSVTIEEDEKPRVSVEELRDMAADLDPDDFDEPVQEFLEELMRCDDPAELRQAATLLLQDEIDLSPDLAAMGVEPDEGLIILLLAVGADVNARNAYGQPPLHLAAHYGYESIVDRLLAAGANLRTRNVHGRFAAEVAATPALAAKLEPPYHPEDDVPLPPEIEDADLDPEGDNGQHHHCTCGHDHHHGHDCDCGGECHCHHS
ncbi:MAG: ankyrin repeat domain-containing protein [Akkermansia sp.]|nr:ankyrin repeat domain-containing protein [Akkermansia sp.]